MKTLKPTKITWILIYLIVVVSSATEHATSHHDVTQHGDSTPWNKQNTIVPVGVQLPEHVLSTQNLSCISADNNIFEIMNKAQETCNGTDVRCTFYHFVNHGYENIGTLDINKQLFDDLLMKFDNWLLTAENVEKRGDKIKENDHLEAASFGLDENSNISSGFKDKHANHGESVNNFDLNSNEVHDDKANSHHIKTPHETHHKSHHGKDHNTMTVTNIGDKQWKDEDHVKLNTEYNTEHRYFEVYLPKDRVTGKPRTIYVEVDQDKNEFVLLDEEIDKKLKGIKPIRIELDELSEIAETAFNEVSKTSNFTEHVHTHLDDDEKAILSDISKHTAVNVKEVHLDNLDVEEQIQNSINPSFYNIDAEQHHKLGDTTVDLIVPNKYINQAQFNIEPHIDKATEDIQNNHFELQESNNTEKDSHTNLYTKEEPFDTTEYNDNNTFSVNGTETSSSSFDYSDISNEHVNDSSTHYFDLSADHENVTLDDSFVQLEELNDTYHDIDYDATHDFSSPNTLNLNEATVPVKRPNQGNNLKSTELLNVEPKLTLSMTDFAGSPLHALPTEKRLKGHINSYNSFPESSVPLSPYTFAPNLGKDLVKVQDIDSHLQPSIPAYATIDSHAADSQVTSSNAVLEHPCVASHISPFDSVSTTSAAPKISQFPSPIFPSPPIECIVRLNTGSKNSPFNVGVSWLPSYSRIEELRLPCAQKPVSLDHVASLQDSVPSVDYSSNLLSSPDHSTDSSLSQNIPSHSFDIQELDRKTLEKIDAVIPPNEIFLSKLGLPNSNYDFDRISTNNPLLVMPCSLGAGTPPGSIQELLQPTISSSVDSGFIQKTPFDKNPKETMTPCSSWRNRYPYTTIPHFLNPYLKPPQFTPSYLEPLLLTPFPPASKIPTVDSVPISSDQNNPCLTGLYPQEIQTIQYLPIAPNPQFSPLNPMIIGSGFPNNALTRPNIWNNIPYLPYFAQNIRNNPPFLNNYLTPTIDQYHKPLLSNTAPLSIVEHPCLSNNNLEMTPLLPVYTSLVQNNLNPSLALGRDLESLSLKYGIPLSKIIHSLETEISDSQPCLSSLDVSNSNSKDGLLTAQQSHTLSKTMEADDENRNANGELLLKASLANVTPLDSSLVGPHLQLDSSLNAHNSQSYTASLEATVPVSLHSSVKNHPTKILLDSSLIGPQLATLSTNNVLFGDENRNVNEVVLSESDSSNLISLDASLTGSHLKIGHPPIVLDTHVSQSDIPSSHIEVLATSSSKIGSKVNKNQPTNKLLETYLTGPNLQSLTPFKPLHSYEIQSINEMVPLESELNDLTPLDMSQTDLTNKLDKSLIPVKPLLTNEKQSINEMVPLESDLIDLMPLDISEAEFVNEHGQHKLLQQEKPAVTLSASINIPSHKATMSSNSSPELKLGSSPIVTDTEKECPIHSVQDNYENSKVHEPTLPNPVQADSKLNIVSQDTKLNEELTETSLDANLTPFKETNLKIVEPVKPDLNLNMNSLNTQSNEKLSLENYVEIPLADTSQISVKKAEFKVIESNPKLHDNNIIINYKPNSPELTVVDAESNLENSLIDTGILLEIKRPNMSPHLDSSIKLENSLVGPSLNIIDSHSPIIETIDHIDSSITETTKDQNKNPIKSTTDSKIQLDSFLIGPNLHQGVKSVETLASDSVTQFDKSYVEPSIYKAGTKTSSVSNAKTHLDTTEIMPNLYQTVSTASSPASSRLDSSLLGASLKPEMETLKDSRFFDSKILDSTLVGPHLSTLPFSSNEIKMMNKELQSKLNIANLVPLDSTFIGPLPDKSEISRYENPEFSSSDIAPGILETINFLNSDYVERRPTKPNTVESIYESDFQELLSKFTNSVSKSQLSPSEFKPCDKLLASIDKQSTDNINMLPTSSDLQGLTLNPLLNTPLSQQDTASEFSPATLVYPEKELGPAIKGPCPSNYYSSPQTLTDLLPYPQGVPQITIRPYSPYAPIKQIIDRAWTPFILQPSPGLHQAIGNTPSLSNTITQLTPEDFKLLFDLASQSKVFPQLSMPNICTLMKAIQPSTEWTTLSNILPAEKYVPSLPKPNVSILPPNSDSSIGNPEYTPQEVDDITSLLDEKSYKLLKDMSILPLSQSSLTPIGPVFEKSEIPSPSLSDATPIFHTDSMKTRPVSPVSISNAAASSSIYSNPQIGLYNPQNIPYMVPTSNIPPNNLQPYSIAPSDSLYSEVVGPVPKIESLPFEPFKSSSESQWHEVPNTPPLLESVPYSAPDREFPQQLLSKPNLDSPIILPSSLLEALLQSSTASNKSKISSSQFLPEFFTPVPPTFTTPLSNAFTNPISPVYATPLSVSYAKPMSASSTGLPFDVSYTTTLTPLPCSPYTANSVIPNVSSPYKSLKSTPLSNYLIAPPEFYNTPTPSRIPYKPYQMYYTPCSPDYPSPLPVENSPYSQTFMSKLPPAKTNPILPVFYEPLTAPYNSPASKPKSISNFGTSTYSGSLTPGSPMPMASSPTGVSPPDLPTYKFSALSTPTLTQPSSTFSTTYVTPISPPSSILPSYNEPLPSNPEIPTQELENLGLLTTSPIPNANIPLLNANQMLHTNMLPLQNDHEYVPNSSAFSSSQIKQIKPNEDKIRSNLQTTSLIEETPYGIVEENMYTCSNDKDMIHEKPNLKYPVESLSYTLTPEKIEEIEGRPKDFTKQDLIPSAPITNLAFEPSLQSKIYGRPLLIPYNTIDVKPLLAPCPAPQLLPFPSLVENLPQSIFENKPLELSLQPLNHPVPILSRPLLKPLQSLSSPAVNLPFLPCPCTDTYLNPYKTLPTDEKTLFSYPYDSEASIDINAAPLDPRGINNIIISPLAFSKVSAIRPFVPTSSPAISPTLPRNLGNYIELPLTNNEPISKQQDTIVEPIPVLNCNLYDSTIIAPLQMPVSPQYISAVNLKKPIISPQYISSILPAQSKLQESTPLNKVSLNYQPFNPLPTGPSNSGKNIFKSALLTSPYSVIPSAKIVESMSSNLNSPQWFSFTPQYSLPASSLPITKSIPVNSLSNVKYSTIFPDVAKLPLTNHIIPSSLFMSSGTDFKTIPLEKSAPLQSLSSYSYPSSPLKEPLKITPHESLNNPLAQTIHPQNKFNPNTQYYNGKYAAALLSSSPYLTQPLEVIDSFQTQPPPKVLYTNKPHPKLSPISAQYASPSSSPSYTSLPLETVPKSQTNRPKVPQYSSPTASINFAPFQSSASARNPFLNQSFKPISEVPSYPVPNNQISSLKLTPYESILLSNLRPLDNLLVNLEPYSVPVTSPIPLSSSPLTKTLTQKSRQYQSEMIPINSQYITQSPSVPQPLPSTSSLLDTPSLKPSLINFQNYSPSLPSYVSNSNTVFSESFPLKSLSSVSGNQKYSSPTQSLITELPETTEAINPVPTTPYSFLKPSFYKPNQSPVTLTNLPVYSSYDVQKSIPYLPIKENYANTVRPSEVSAISAPEPSRLSLGSLNTGMIEDIQPYDLTSESKDKYSQLPLNFNQQKQTYPSLSYLTMPQPNHITSASSKYKTARPRPFSTPSLAPEDVELIDTTDFIPISSIQSEALTSSYSPSDTKAPIFNSLTNIPESNSLLSSPYTILSNTDSSFSPFKQLPPKSITNTQSVQEPDISQFSANTILSNSGSSSSSANQLKLLYNQRPPSPVYLSPQEYEELTKSLPSSQTSSSSSPIASPCTYIDPQLINNLLTSRPLTPLFTTPLSKTPENLLQLLLYGKYSPLQETSIDITPEKENIQSLLNKYRPANKIKPLGLKVHPCEPQSSIVELLSGLDSVQLVNPLTKPSEPYVEYIESIKSNDENNYVTAENVNLDENKPDVCEAIPFTKSLPEIIKSLNIPNYYSTNAQRPQKLSKFDYLNANNHIGKSPQFITATTFKTSPTDAEITTVYPEILKDLSNMPTKHFGSVHKLDTSSKLIEYYPEIANVDEAAPSTNSYTQNYIINPSLKSFTQMKLPTNSIEVSDTLYHPLNNIDDVNYSGFKKYEMPSLKSPQMTQNLGTPSQLYSPSVVKSSNEYQHRFSSPPDFYEPAEIYEPVTPQYQLPKKLTSPPQSKSDLDTLQENPDLNEYSSIEDESSVHANDIKEDNDLKVSLINYINKKDNIKSNIDNNNQEFTIPIGNIVITKKEPYNADTIETNNPSIGLKVWKSKVKIVQAELTLKFKDLSVINFMPVVNNLDKYDMEEIRNIIKNYIDEKYGNHIEINEPYTVNNQYTVIRDFDPNAISNKYNLLWPTNYV